MYEPAFQIHQINERCWKINFLIDNQIVATTAVSTQEEIGEACLKLSEAYQNEKAQGHIS